MSKAKRTKSPKVTFEKRPDGGTVITHHKGSTKKGKKKVVYEYPPK